MVHLIENYYAIPNNMGFTLSVDKGRKDKAGNSCYETIGYVENFEEVVLLLKRKAVDLRLSNGDTELSEACTVIKETTAEIRAAMRSIDPLEG